MWKLFIGAILIIQSSLVIASDKGNGGDGVEINGKVYLWDLYESGIHASPYFSGISAEVDIQRVLEKKFETFEVLLNRNASQTGYNYRDFISLLGSKITEIRRADSVFGNSLLQSVNLYRWSLFDGEVVDVLDDDGSDIVTRLSLLAIAHRSYRTIKFSNDKVKKMDLGNLVATALHEAGYGFITPDIKFERGVVEVIESAGARREIYGDVKVKYQSSRRVREVIAQIFRDDLNASNLGSIIKGSFPSSSNWRYTSNTLSNLIQNTIVVELGQELMNLKLKQNGWPSCHLEQVREPNEDTAYERFSYHKITFAFATLASSGSNYIEALYHERSCLIEGIESTEN